MKIKKVKIKHKRVWPLLLNLTNKTNAIEVWKVDRILCDGFILKKRIYLQLFTAFLEQNWVSVFYWKKEINKYL